MIIGLLMGKLSLFLCGGYFLLQIFTLFQILPKQAGLENDKMFFFSQTENESN